jgi:hypothetical protein
VAAALLSPASSHSWRALRARDISPGRAGITFSEVKVGLVIPHTIYPHASYYDKVRETT